MKKIALVLVLFASMIVPAAAVPGGEVTFDTDRDRYRDGAIVTLTLHNGTGEDFRSRPKIDFVVYVNTPDEVAQMRAEAETDDADKKIVSGIVRRGKRYNPDWNFTMGPASIVLGDLFIEVCDGSPFYVQRHRSEWLGERWCPWSSYVEKVGR